MGSVGETTRKLVGATALGGSLALAACTPKTGTTTTTASQYDSPDRPLAEEKRLRDQLVAMFDKAGPPTADAAAGAKAALEETLKRGATDNVRISETRCSAVACYTDVEYRSREEFQRFDKGKIRDPESPLERWGAASGRTGLVNDGKRMVATWYVFVPGWKPPRGNGQAPATGGVR